MAINDFHEIDAVLHMHSTPIYYISTTIVPSSTASGLQVMKMCQAFHQEEYDIRLVSPTRGGQGAVSVESLQLECGLSTMFPMTTIPTRGKGKRILYDIRAVGHAKRHGANLVYTRSFRCAVFAALLGLHVVVEVHDVPGGKWGPRYLRYILSSKKTAAIVVITEALRRELVVRFGDSYTCPIVVASDGVDNERFSNQPDPLEARRSVGLVPGDFTVGYAGSLYGGRGGEFIIELAARIPEVRFLVIGGPSERANELAAEVRARGIGNVHFIGAVPNSDLPLRLAACDVLLMPYGKGRVSASGGGDISRVMSPLKMFEYLATGRLIISSDLTVLREVLHEGNAVLCPPEDIDAWEDALRTASNDRALRTRLGQRAKEDAKRYDWRERVKKIMETIEI